MARWRPAPWTMRCYRSAHGDTQSTRPFQDEAAASGGACRRGVVFPEAAGRGEREAALARAGDGGGYARRRSVHRHPAARWRRRTLAEGGTRIARGRRRRSRCHRHARDRAGGEGAGAGSARGPARGAGGAPGGVGDVEGHHAGGAARLAPAAFDTVGHEAADAGLGKAGLAGFHRPRMHGQTSRSRPRRGRACGNGCRRSRGGIRTRQQRMELPLQILHRMADQRNGHHRLQQPVQAQGHEHRTDDAPERRASLVLAPRNVAYFRVAKTDFAQVYRMVMHSTSLLLLRTSAGR